VTLLPAAILSRGVIIVRHPTTLAMKNRLDRVNELIKRELSELISRTVEGMPAKLVTVREVDISPDLKHASVWMGIIVLNILSALDIPEPPADEEFQDDEKA
jgi:hypothetical protein